MGKWYLHRFYSGDAEIRKHLPPTSLLSADRLVSFLNQYRAVYIKPDREHKGKGIMKAWRTGGGFVLAVSRGAVVKCASLEQLYEQIKQRSLSQPYIIQRAIPLARIRGRPFDIRVMMMRNMRDRWQFFGLYSKVAGPKSIVTNITGSRGYVTLFERSMKESLGYSKDQAARVKSRLIRLSGRICRRAGKIKYYQKIGNDFAVDKQGKIWLIEVNFTYPGFRGFSMLPNRKYYRRIKKMNAILRKRRLRRAK